MCFPSLYFRSVGRRTERVRASSSRLPTKSWSPQIRPASSSTDSRTSSSRPPPSLSSGTVCFTPQWGGGCPTLHAELWLHPTLWTRGTKLSARTIVFSVESLYVDLVSGANGLKICKQTLDIIERKLHTRALEKWNPWKYVIGYKTVFSSQCVCSHVSGLLWSDFTFLLYKQHITVFFQQRKQELDV